MPGIKPGVVHCAKRIVEFQFEAGIHASDHIILHRHAGFLRRYWIFPGEVLDDVLDQRFNDGPRFALVLDHHLDLFASLCSVSTFGVRS